MPTAAEVPVLLDEDVTYPGAGDRLMIELAPGWTLTEEERHPHHWIGTCGELVLVFAYIGSQDDPRHIEVSTRVVEEHHRRRGGPVKLLFALAPNGKPPSGRVRSAMQEAVARVESRMARCAGVVGGSGFAAAIHRGVAASLVSLIRPQFPFTIFGEVRPALEFLIRPGPLVFGRLLPLCEALARGAEGASALRSTVRAP